MTKCPNDICAQSCAKSACFKCVQKVQNARARAKYAKYVNANTFHTRIIYVDMNSHMSANCTNVTNSNACYKSVQMSKVHKCHLCV